MTTLCLWTLVTVSYQTFLCVLFSWFTLTCQFAPKPTELHEVTLIKVLYLYDPQDCDRVYFYNYTRVFEWKVLATIVWPTQNPISTRFRVRVRIWLGLHIVWAVFCFTMVTLRGRPYGFYVGVIPFTLVGAALLVLDIVFACIFVTETVNYKGEMELLSCINEDQKSLMWIRKPFHGRSFTNLGQAVIHDTTWIPLIIAYGCIRGVVIWIFNFWIIKDNYFDGMVIYRAFRNNKTMFRAKTSQLS